MIRNVGKEVLIQNDYIFECDNVLNELKWLGLGFKLNIDDHNFVNEPNCVLVEFFEYKLTTGYKI